MTEERVKGPRGAAKRERIIGRLSFNQAILLRKLTAFEHPTELSALCKEADASWDEAYQLHDSGLVSVAQDLKAKCLNALITPAGKAVEEQMTDEECRLSWRYRPPAEVLKDYTRVKQLPDGRWIGSHQLMFHWTLHVDIDDIGYAERWCIDTREHAEEALEAWDGTGEPLHWHKHIPSLRDPRGERYRDRVTGQVYTPDQFRRSDGVYRSDEEQVEHLKSISQEPT